MFIGRLCVKGNVYPTKCRFPKTACRDNKVFLNEQCIQLEENNRRGKTRDLFRKIGDIKGTYCPKMGTIKDINTRDLVDVEEIKNRWKEYTEELYKKDPDEPDDYDGGPHRTKHSGVQSQVGLRKHCCE